MTVRAGVQSLSVDFGLHLHWFCVCPEPICQYHVGSCTPAGCVPAQNTCPFLPQVCLVFCSFGFQLPCGRSLQSGPTCFKFCFGCLQPFGATWQVALHSLTFGPRGFMGCIRITPVPTRSVGLQGGATFCQQPLPILCLRPPCACSKFSTHQGQWKGVAVLSKFPTRALQIHGPPEVFLSSRTLITTTLLNDIWVTGGAVYGEPDGHLYPQHLAHNELLLSTVVGQVCNLNVGPRFIAGDWNCLPSSLPAFDMLHSSGFRDLQDVAWCRWGTPPKPTCKHKTRKDFCYISPELQALLLECQVIDDVWPDHAVLQGTFKGIAMTVPQQIWSQPQQFTWPHDWQVEPSIWHFAEGDVDDRYQAVWHHIETSAAAALPFEVLKAQFGRACARKTKAVVPGKNCPCQERTQWRLCSAVSLCLF